MTNLSESKITLTAVLAVTLVFVAMVAISPLAFADTGSCASGSGGNCSS